MKIIFDLAVDLIMSAIAISYILFPGDSWRSTLKTHMRLTPEFFISESVRKENQRGQRSKLGPIIGLIMGIVFGLAAIWVGLDIIGIAIPLRMYLPLAVALFGTGVIANYKSISGRIASQFLRYLPAPLAGNKRSRMELCVASVGLALLITPILSSWRDFDSKVVTAVVRRIKFPQSQAELIGTYKAKYPFGSATLLLSRDQTFIQQVFLSGPGSRVKVEGKWRFDQKNSNVILDESILLNDGYGNDGGNHDRTIKNSVFSAAKHALSRRTFLKKDQATFLRMAND